MPRINSRRELTLSALFALFVWLIAVVGGVLWFRPEFWVQPGQRFDRAVDFAAQKRWRESIDAVDRALHSDPNNVDYLVFKGYRQLDAGDQSGAQQTFDRALTLDRTRTDARLGLATALSNTGRKREALSALEPISPDTATDADLHRRSQMYSSLGAPQSALDDLATLLRRDPNNEAYLKDAAQLTMQSKQWNRAEPLLARLGATAKDPATREWADTQRDIALEASAVESARRGDHLDAALRLRVLAQDKPDELTLKRREAHALRAAGQNREAELVLREVLARDPADIDTRVLYAWMLNTQRRYAEAWRLIERLPQPSRDPKVLDLQARTAVWAGRFAEAVNLLRALLNERPDDADLWRDLAESWRRLGDDRQTAEALGAYLRLRSHDARAREHLAQLLAKAGSLDAAIAHYEQLVSEKPGDSELLRSLGLLHETAGNLDRAAAAYRGAVESMATLKPELLLRLARVDRWRGHHDTAVAWYESYLRLIEDRDLRRTAEMELALSLLESGKPEAALARLHVAGNGTSLNAAELLIAARATTETGQPAEAARLLELLAQARELTPEERRWLAGRYRAADNRTAALAAYERVAAASAMPDDEVLEAIGDLRYDSGDFAGALKSFLRVTDSDRVALKTARSAARAGELTIASNAYERHVRAHPDDLQARLDAARYQASAGHPDMSIANYKAYIAARGPADLRLELARVSLAARQFDAAESWARQAVAAGENYEDSSLALAQSLHLQGRHREARDTLSVLARTVPARKDAYEWRGYVAIALDRHLEAYRSFERAIAAGAKEAGVLIMQSTAALKRGDFGRSLRSVNEAMRSGETPPAADAARRALRDATLPVMYLPVWSAGDSNDLFVSQGGGGVFLMLPGNRARLTFEAASGTMSQRGFSTRADAFKMRVSHLFPVPELSLDLSMGMNNYDRAPARMTWQVTGMYALSDTASVGIDAVRDAVLPAMGRSDLRQFNRVLDLRALGPSFQSTTFRGLLQVSPLPLQQAHVEAGAERFQDGNRRTFAYVHHQFPLQSSARAWTAFRPNMFFETFRRESPFYFSPRRHITAGTMLHMILRNDIWEAEWELNPQLLRTDGETGMGAHGLFNLSARVRRALIGGGAFVFWDGLEDHIQWRVGGRVTIPLAR